MDDLNVQDGRERKRQCRSSACDLCRSRKVKCDGGRPCQNCDVARIACTYGSLDTLPKGKSDMILEGMVRIETSLSEIRHALRQQNSEWNHPSPMSGSRDMAALSPSPAASNEDKNSRWTNAVLTNEHLSGTESIWKWETFNVMPELKRNRQPVFNLEAQRPSFDVPEHVEFPSMILHEIDDIVAAFRRTINFAFPILPIEDIDGVHSLILQAPSVQTTSGSRALLIMALGSACQVCDLVARGRDHIRSGIAQKQRTALNYFTLFLKQSHLSQIELSVTATQCLLLAALFCSYLQRPLQAWSFVSAAATKCRTLLCYSSHIPASGIESLRRIFWACFILESDYLAELAALPQSGVAAMESTVPLPSEYCTSRDSNEQELSPLYFLACISMRRLLNRVHDLLYAPKTGIALFDIRFSQIVSELDHQLEQWRACLPRAFHFTVDDQPTANEHSGFLRQRYLTCRSVIYRPYLTQALRTQCTANELAHTRLCLDACLLHIINLRSFSHTILVDTWICSLSMASAMLILLAAYQQPQLKELIKERVGLVGPHLSYTIEGWIMLAGDGRSPSIEQSLNLINQIAKYLR